MEGLKKTALILIILVLGVWILREGDFLLVPLVWGIFFSFALAPISDFLENYHIPRSIAIILSILFVFLILVGVMYVLLNQMIGLLREIPEIGQLLTQKIEQSLRQMSELVGYSLFETENKTELWSLVRVENLNATLFSTGKSLTLAGIIPLYIFLLMYYRDFFEAFLVRYSAEHKDKILIWAKDSGKVIQSYLSGMVLVTVIVGLLSGLYFYLIDIKYFALFAAFIAVLNLIPYVGVFVSSFFVILYVFLTTDSLFYPILTFGVLWGIQLLENNLITPVVVGYHVKVNALVVVLAILLGGWVWGISGMVLFIPLVGVLKITLDRQSDYEAFGFLLGDSITSPSGDFERKGWLSGIFSGRKKEGKSRLPSEKK